MLHSCQNCWFNGLQYDAIGLAVGYCVRHRMILYHSEQTTCGQHMRKDLPLPRVREFSALHAARFPADRIVMIADSRPADDQVGTDERDIDHLRADPVGDVVADYGLLDAKIESLAQLRRLSGARAEVALICLGRGYVNNCVTRHGAWTSGLHLFWWTKKRLTEIPVIAVADLRWTGRLPLNRQLQLTRWSIMMLRLLFIDDITRYATDQGQPMVIGLLQQAAAAEKDFNVDRLARWMRKVALPQLDSALSKDHYTELARALAHAASPPSAAE